MSNTKTGGPVFPAKRYNPNTMAIEDFGGMTLRDYFAAKALSIAWEAYDKGYTGEPENVTASVVKHAYQIADAILVERSK